MKMSFNKAGAASSCQIPPWVLKAGHLTMGSSNCQQPCLCGTDGANANKCLATEVIR